MSLAALNGWSLVEPLPPGVDGAAIAGAIANLDAGLAPADPVWIGAQMLKVFAVCGNPEGVTSQAAAELYAESLTDIPADLLEKACQDARRKCKFPPKPADIRQFVESDLSNRHYQRRRLETAALKWRQEAPQRERAAQIAAERAAGRNLYSLDDVRASVKRVTDDDGA